jgi:hypothetical protein
LFEFESYAKLTHFPDLNENRVPVERLQAKKKSRRSGRDPLSTKQQNNKGGSAASSEGLTVGSRVFDVEKNKLYLN